jgi:hypothetical protein
MSVWSARKVNQRLKRWESPRREGRNDKGRGGSARQKQLKKQAQMLRKRLKDNDKTENNKKQGGRETNSSLYFFMSALSL